MKNTYEVTAQKNKGRSTLGYGIMWLFIAMLIGILPFTTANGHAVYYFAGSIALVVSLLRFVKWFKMDKS